MASLNEAFTILKKTPLVSTQKIVPNKNCPNCGHFGTFINQNNIYFCQKCGHAISLSKSFPKPLLTKCPSCSGNTFITSNDGNMTQICAKCKFTIKFD